MKFGHAALATVLMTGLWAGAASAQGYLISANGKVAIGVQAEGHLDANVAGLGGPSTQAGPLGIAYDFTGQGGRSGWQDALSPGCLCEAWGVSGNGAGNSIGDVVGNNGINLVSQNFVPGTSFTSVSTAAGSGLTITQTVTRSAETAAGALFQAAITIANATASTITDVRYARAMDWDVPPTEFSEHVTHGGVSIGAPGNLLRATDNGFADPNPITAMSDGGICGVVNSNGPQGGACDHGSLFVFGFGDLAAGASTTFNIFYGAGASLSDALSLLGAISAELYSLGQSSSGGAPSAGDPTFVFAFNGVGLPPVPTVPAPGALGIFGLGLLALAAAQRRRAAAAA